MGEHCCAILYLFWSLKKKESNFRNVSLHLYSFKFVLCSLKGVCHEIFDPYFFHDSNPSGPLINSLKYFRIRFRNDLRCVQHTAKIISVLCITPWRWFLYTETQRCATHHREDFRGVQHTAEIISAVCNRLRRRSPWGATHRRDKLHPKETKPNSSLVYGCF